MTNSKMDELEKLGNMVRDTRALTNRKDSKAAEMLLNIENNIADWSCGKVNRWLGYAQCLLVAEGATTIDELRDIMRRYE